MKKVWIFLISFIILNQISVSQDIYQEGRVFFIKLSSIGLSLGNEYDTAGLLGQFSFRITDRFDVGIILGGSTFSQTPEKQNLHYTQNEIIAGTVLGYTIHPNRISWGIRFSLDLSVNIETVDGVQYVLDYRTHLYTGQLKTYFFRQVDIGNTTLLYPGIGLSLIFSHTTTNSNLIPNSGNRIALGIYTKLPLSIKVLRKNQLIIEPVYWFTSQGSLSGLNLKFCFGKK